MVAIKWQGVSPNHSPVQGGEHIVDSTSGKEPVKAYTKTFENSKKKEREIMVILNYSLVFQDTNS